MFELKVFSKLYRLPFTLHYALHNYNLATFTFLSSFSPMHLSFHTYSEKKKKKKKIYYYSPKKILFHNCTAVLRVLGIGKSHAVLYTLSKHIIEQSPFQRAFSEGEERQGWMDTKGWTCVSLFNHAKSEMGFISRPTWLHLSYLTGMVTLQQVLHRLDMMKDINEAHILLEHQLEARWDVPRWCTVLRQMNFTMGIFFRLSRILSQPRWLYQSSYTGGSDNS